MLRAVTHRKTPKTMIIRTRDYCAECETPLQTTTNANGNRYCPQCKSLIVKEEVLAVRVCPLCNRNVWNFRKLGISEMCPHCRQEFITSAGTQLQSRKTNQ